MENKKGCYNCDNSMHMGWNDDWCKYAKNNSCSIMKEHKHFILRRDKRSCENCLDPETCSTANDVHSCTSRGYDCWKPNNQENKEQEMSYKPTSKCTLKNIADELSKHGCYESKAEFFDFLIETRDGYSCTVESCWNFEGNSELTRFLTKTEKRRNWLLKFGFIEEEGIKIDPWTILKYTIDGDDTLCRFVEFNGVYGLVNERFVHHGKDVSFKEGDFPIRLTDFANSTGSYSIDK